MKIHFDNVNLDSSSGPNSFAKRITDQLTQLGHTINLNDGPNSDISLVFIEPSGRPLAKKIVQRLDGIWFSPDEFYTKNSSIKSLYQKADCIVWQSEFDKKMITKWWGFPKDGTVIKNGIEKQSIVNQQVKNQLQILKQRYEKIFVSSANWHTQKRLNENINLFKHLKKFYPSSCLLVLGSNANVPKDLDVFVVGSQPHEICIQIFQSCDWMIHLAWLDHCPNTVVEALSSNLPVICSEDGGTKELVQNYGIVLKEKNNYNYDLVHYDDPPTLDLNQLVNLLPERKVLGDVPDVSIKNCASLYESLLTKICKNNV